MEAAAPGGGYWYMVRCEGEWEGRPREATMGGELRRLEDRIRADVAILSDTLVPRNPDHPEALGRAERWIRGRWERQGYAVGARYDTWPDSPGANDNASGTSVLLHLSEMLVGQPADRTVRLVAFTVQEPPHNELGSQRYASRARRRGEDIRVMRSMDAIGIYRHEPGTRRLPFPFDLLYPDRGDFLAFIGDLRTRPASSRRPVAFTGGAAFPSRPERSRAGSRGLPDRTTNPPGTPATRRSGSPTPGRSALPRPTPRAPTPWRRSASGLSRGSRWACTGPSGSCLR